MEVDRFFKGIHFSVYGRPQYRFPMQLADDVDGSEFGRAQAQEHQGSGG